MNFIRDIRGFFSNNGIDPEFRKVCIQNVKRGVVIGAGIGGVVSTVGVIATGILIANVGEALSGSGKKLSITQKMAIVPIAAYEFGYMWIIPICIAGGAFAGAKYGFSATSMVWVARGAKMIVETTKKLPKPK